MIRCGVGDSMDNEGNSNRKLDEIIQRQEDLENTDDVSEVPGPLDVESVPALPSPLVGGLKRYYGEEKGDKTQCAICKIYYVNLDRHLTEGKNKCSRFLQSSGRDPGEVEAELVCDREIEFLVGATICDSFLRLCENWLEPKFVKPRQELRDHAVESLQRILDMRMGLAARSPSVSILICVAELAFLNQEGIRKKFKSKEPPEDPNIPDRQPELGQGFFSPSNLS